MEQEITIPAVPVPREEGTPFPLKGLNQGRAKYYYTLLFAKESTHHLGKGEQSHLFETNDFCNTLPSLWHFPSGSYKTSL